MIRSENKVKTKCLGAIAMSKQPPLPGRKLKHRAWPPLPPQSKSTLYLPCTLPELALSLRKIFSNQNWNTLQPIPVTRAKIPKQSSRSLRASIIIRKTATQHWPLPITIPHPQIRLIWKLGWSGTLQLTVGDNTKTSGTFQKLEPPLTFTFSDKDGDLGLHTHLTRE